MQQVAADAFGNALADSLVTEVRDAALPEEIRKLSTADRERAHRLALSTRLNLGDQTQAQELVDIMRMATTGTDVGEARREELTTNALRRMGLTDAQVSDARQLYLSAGLIAAPPQPLVSPPNSLSGLEADVTGRQQLAEVHITARRLGDPVLGTRAIDHMAIGAGEVARRVNEEITSRPWLEYALIATQIVAAPVSFAVNKAIETSPLGKAIENKLGELHATLTERFSDSNHSPADAVDGASGAMTLGSLGVGFGVKKTLGILDVSTPKARTLAAVRERFRTEYRTSPEIAERGAAWVARPGRDDVHHTVALQSAGNERARQHLGVLGVDINDPKINGIALPRSADDNPFGKVTHNMTKPDAYYNFVESVIVATTSRDEAVAAIRRIQRDLMTGQTPWLR